MTRSRILLAGFLAVCLALAACSKGDDVRDAPKRSPSVEIVGAEAKGFTVGAMMNANTVYVFFDTQCLHCAHLWEASIALQKKAKFIWIPVGLLNAASSSQGAALLSVAGRAFRCRLGAQRRDGRYRTAQPAAGRCGSQCGRGVRPRVARNPGTSVIRTVHGPGHTLRLG